MPDPSQIFKSFKNLPPDYNNARVLDFQDVSNYISNAVPIQQVARMPWHDVSSKVTHTHIYCKLLIMTVGSYDT